MMDYATYCRIRQLDREGHSSAQIARMLTMNEKTIRKWLAKKDYQQRKAPARGSKLDAFKPQIAQWIGQADFTTVQIYQKLQKAGYNGGRSILGEYMRRIRPRHQRAYQTLRFEPGEAAQIDWGSYGSVQIGNTRRRVSFLTVVLCHSRLLYAECFVQERIEHLLAGLDHAFARFGGVPRRLIVDNMKTAVIEHRPGQAAVFNARFVDFCRHFATDPQACTPKRPNEKGRVESAVGYIKGNFFNGRDLDALPAEAPLESLNAQLRLWLEETANRRQHRETRARPCDLLAAEQAAMLPLNANAPDIAVTLTARVTNRCRVVCETNRYSVPPELSQKQVTLRRSHDRIVIYYQHKLMASHCRSYQRHAEILDPEHQIALLNQYQRTRADARRLLFEELDPVAPLWLLNLAKHHPNTDHHIRQILLLADLHGKPAVAHALRQSHDFAIYTWHTVQNLLQRQLRGELPAAGPMAPTSATRPLLELRLPSPDLSHYPGNPQPPSGAPELPSSPPDAILPPPSPFDPTCQPSHRNQPTPATNQT